MSAKRDRTRYHLFISGRVQMVGFRAFTSRRASEIGIDGWVRNLPDGRVEAVLEGEEDRVTAMLEELNRGPSAARVKDVELVEEEPAGINGFRVKY